MKTFTIEITDEEYKVFCHEVADPELWINNAVAGKINSIRKRLIPVAVNELIKDPKTKSIPATEAKILTKHFSKSGYKNAKQRKESEETP